MTEKSAQTTKTASSVGSHPPVSVLQRACACGNHTYEGECEDCKKKKAGLQRAPSGIGGDLAGQAAPPIVHEVLREPGVPLDVTTRARMEAAFSGRLTSAPVYAASGMGAQGRLEINHPHDCYEQQADQIAADVVRSSYQNPLAHLQTAAHVDFSRVRVHTGDKASQSARAVQARAFTVGHDIVFDLEQYAAHHLNGRLLLAHELTHVIQQNSGLGASSVMRQEAVAEPPASGQTQESQPPPEVSSAAGQQQVRFDSRWLESEDPRAFRMIQFFVREVRRLAEEINGELIPRGISARPLEIQAINHYFDYWTEISSAQELSPRNLAVLIHKAQTALRVFDTVMDRASQRVGTAPGELLRLRDQTRDLIGYADQIKQTPALQNGIQVLENERQTVDRQRRIEQAVDFIQQYVERHWESGMSDQAGRLHGLVVAQRLVQQYHLNREQIHEVLDTLRDRSPALLEKALFRGGTVRSLLGMGIGGLQAYRARGEGFFAGVQRAGAESRMADPLRYRQFSTAETLEAVGWAILGTFEGIGNAIINNVTGIISIFTAEFWTGIRDFFTNFLPTFIDNEVIRFEMGQMVGQASVQEERRLATADPDEFGRTVGNIFGQALVEIVLSFIGLGWVLRAVRASPRLMRIAAPLARLAQRVARTSTAARGLRAAQIIGESINTLGRRLRGLRNRIPAITRLGQLRRELRAAELAEEELAAAVRRVERLEEDARRALASGNEELAQRRISEMNEASEVLERQIADLERQTGAAQPDLPERQAAERPAEAAAREAPPQRAADTQEFLDDRPVPEELVDRAAFAQRNTPDGAHTITITRRGQIMRCTTCQEMADRFRDLVSQRPDLANRLENLQRRVVEAAESGNQTLVNQVSDEAAQFEQVLRQAEQDLLVMPNTPGQPTQTGQALGAADAPSFQPVTDELNMEGPSGPASGTLREQYEDAIRRAQQGQLVTAEGGASLVDLAVHPHQHAPIVRQILDLTGADVQSVHIGATSTLRGVSGYSRGEALTTLLPPDTHRLFDGFWMDWARLQRRAGHTQTTVAELHRIMVEAIEQTPNLSARTRGAMIHQLYQEVFSELGLAPNHLLNLPFPNIHP